MIIISFVFVSCHEQTTTTTQAIATTTTKDLSWKIDYDMVDTSSYFLNDVSVCYQIFPISFADSNGDGYGDIKGITENIDYLKNTLNVDCLWINPVNTSPSYHKYDVTNYYEIDPQLGTMADYEELLDVSEENGIKILMDFVINHTSYNHPWFDNSRSSQTSEYRDWYVWNSLTDKVAYPSKVGWYLNNGQYYYASFWDQMPELNFDNEFVREEIKNIAEFWILKGVDGFRIDAAKHIYDSNEYPSGTSTITENVQLFKELNSFVKSVNPDAFIVGEIASISSDYVSDYYAGMDSAFNFEFSSKLIYSLQAGYDSLAIQSLVNARDAFGLIRTEYIDSVFLTNHDQNRIFDQIGQDINKMKLASRILLTLPGISWIYYGEELGMSGVKPDETIRQPFIWGEDSSYNTTGKTGGISDWTAYNLSLDGVTSQLEDENSLLNVYIQMISLKKSESVIQYGDIQLIDNDENRLMTYLRSYEGTTYLVIHNMSSQEKAITHDLDSFNIIYQSEDFSSVGQLFSFSPYSTTILEVYNSDIVFRK